MTQDLEAMAKAVRDAVLKVPVHERGRAVAMGADGTPTSYIDRVAEDAVLRWMDEHDFQANLLSEEAGFVDRGFSETLVADPVDGTHNASVGIPFYSVSLALGSGALSGMRQAVVMNLVTGDAFQATNGQGATLNGSPIRVTPPGSERLLLSYMGAAASPRTHEVAARFKRVRSFGCVSLEICAVACGQADAFFIDYPDVRKSPRVVDIAGAVLVLREAGGEAFDANCEILDMPLSLMERRNMSALASGELLEMIR